MTKILEVWKEVKERINEQIVEVLDKAVDSLVEHKRQNDSLTKKIERVRFAVINISSEVVEEDPILAVDAWRKKFLFLKTEIWREVKFKL